MKGLYSRPLPPKLGRRVARLYKLRGRIVSLALAMLLAPALVYRANFDDLYQCRRETASVAARGADYLHDKLVYLFLE